MVLKRVASSDRPMSARTQKLLGLLPKNSAGNDVLNPKTGAAKALADMRKTQVCTCVCVCVCVCVCGCVCARARAHARM